MAKKTLAMKLLESYDIVFKVYEYPESERDAETIAGLLGVSPDRLFKTLVAVREGKKHLLVMLPGSHQLDLKKLAKELGEKKVKLATHAEAEKLTGLQVGGISPLALMNRGFSVILDESAFQHDSILVSAGKKGINLELNPKDLGEITEALLLDVKA
ncbi:MAG: aminoacyl-tRNA deacylase [Candidatus Promineifilaceae bacterium]